MEKLVHRRKFRANRGVGERAKYVRQTVGKFEWGGWQGCSRQRETMSVRAPKLIWVKNIKNHGFLIFVNYGLMSCEVFT